jgi:hypothetical protein
VHAPRRRGAIAIGHEHDEALALVIRCARDSMPQLRLAVLLDVATHPDSRVIEISERRACGASSAPMELAASSTRRRRAVNALAAWSAASAWRSWSILWWMAGMGAFPTPTSPNTPSPVHADAPAVMDVIFVEEHDPHVNPLGVKGVGEIATGGRRARDCQRNLSRHRKTYPRTAITPDKLLWM